jgi:biopolymer transport protein ExbD
MSKPFRKRNALAVHEMHYGPNMTPMVDVVMVILIFFMSSTAILGPEWFLKSTLPTVKASATAASQDTKRVNIRMLVTPGGTRLEVDDRKDIPIDGLAAILRTFLDGRSPETLIVPITPDPGTPYDDVVRVHEICERLQLKKYGLLDAAGASDAQSPPATKRPEGAK